jgi:hypothetical protein
VAKSTVDKYRVRSGKVPSPTWKAFLKNHLNDLVSIDFLHRTDDRFKLLFVVVVLAHSRRKVLHFNVTANPTAQRDDGGWPWRAKRRGCRIPVAWRDESLRRPVGGPGLEPQGPVIQFPPRGEWKAIHSPGHGSLTAAIVPFRVRRYERWSGHTWQPVENGTPKKGERLRFTRA